MNIKIDGLRKETVTLDVKSETVMKAFLTILGLNEEMFTKEDGVYRLEEMGGSHSSSVDELVYSKDKYPIKHEILNKLVELQGLIESDETLDMETRNALRLLITKEG